MKAILKLKQVMRWDARHRAGESYSKRREKLMAQKKKQGPQGRNRSMDAHAIRVGLGGLCSISISCIML